MIIKGPLNIHFAPIRSNLNSIVGRGVFGCCEIGHMHVGMDGVTRPIECDRHYVHAVVTDMVSSKLKYLKIRDITEFRLLKAKTPFLTHQIEPSEKCGCSNKVHMLSDEGSIMQQQQWRHNRDHDHYQLPDTVEAFLDEYCFSSAIDNQQSVPQNPKL